MRRRRANAVVLMIAAPFAAGATLPILSVAPSGPVVPAQLLRISVWFAAPQGGGPALPAALLRADRTAIPNALLDQRLWSPDRRTLTLLLDPGRVKTGLLARAEAGPVLRPGENVSEALQVSRHGNEMHFEVNTLAPLQLIDRLRPALKAAGRAIVVNTSAGISLGAKELDWDQLVRPKAFRKLYGPPYVASKAALNVITSALARELASDGIIVRAADPGPNKTRLTRGPGTPLWMRLFYGLLPGVDKGAQKIFDAAFSPQWADRTGIFISGGK